MLIERVAHEPQSMRRWEDYVAGHPDTTVYHGLAWRAIFEKGFGYPSWHLLAREPGEGPVRGALPLYLVRTPVSRRLVAAPFRDRGGVLWDSPEAFAALVAHALEIGRSARAGSLRLKSLVPYPEREALALGLVESRHWVHSVAKLAGMTPETLWRGIGDKNRNMVRQARRRGLRCEPLAPSAANLDAWHRLHVATQKRLGVPPFPARFFEAMAGGLTASGGFVLLGVHDGAALRAATVLLVHRDTAIYAYSASDAGGQEARANDLMLYEAMRWLIGRGIGVFDMGSDSPRQESLLFFKRKWLARQSPIPHYTHGDAAPVDSSDAKYAFARACFRLLPAPLLSGLGGALARYFG
ncbi:MAG: GNAT family N-acetyltransferase [Burkholderiales bacterium]|nr:GNAT family N-acetyltransferase [Burkholderiales bacterium]